MKIRNNILRLTLWTVIFLIDRVISQEENLSHREDVSNALVSIVKFDNYLLHVFPSCELNKGCSSLGESTLEEPSSDVDRKAEFFTTWVSKSHSIISLRNHLLVNQKHFKLPSICKELWLINDKLICPDIGIIRESIITQELDVLLNANRHDCISIHADVKYVAEDSLAQNTLLKKKNDQEYALVVGDHFLTVSGSIIEYSGRKYTVNRGDLVVISRQGDLEIDHNKYDFQSKITEKGNPPRQNQ
jgi:hypothetical protein